MRPGERTSEATSKDQMASGKSKQDLSTAHLIFLFFFLPVFVLYGLSVCGAEAGTTETLTFSELWDIKSFLVVIGFILLQAGLYLLPIGKLARGKRSRTGERETYHINGGYSLLISFALVTVLGAFDLADVSLGRMRCLRICFAGSVLSILVAIFFHLKSFHANKAQLVDHCVNGNVLREFFLGREVNPKLGKLPVKFFMMLRIGFIGWGVVNVCFLVEAVKTKGTPPTAFVLVVLFQLIYVVDTLFDEEITLFSKEITSDSFGYLMAFGEIVWIPFTSNFQANYLLHHPRDLDCLQASAITALFAVGFYIYHKSNTEKHNFRRDPHNTAFANIKTIDTVTGKKLLVCGWWGWMRHPNYLGDILCFLSWSLPCGYSHIIVYLSLFFVIRMLAMRAVEMEEDCHLRYGQAWEEYCRQVGYKFIPHIY